MRRPGADLPVCMLFALLVTASAAAAKDRLYTDVVFADVFKNWDHITQADPPGLTIMTPQKLHFAAIYAAAPMPCSAGVLQTIMASHGMAAALAKVPITHCVELAADNRRRASIFVQDVLVPGLEKDARIGGRLDVHADLLGYEVKDPRDRNAPVMLLNRFEPIATKNGSIVPEGAPSALTIGDQFVHAEQAIGIRP